MTAHKNAPPVAAGQGAKTEHGQALAAHYTPDEPHGYLALTRRLSDVAAKPVDWLWPGRFARGKVSLIAGNPGLGKSQLTASMAAIVTTGGRWPVDRTPCAIGSVLILSAEDDAADTIVPRLMASGADLDRVHQFEAVREYTDDGVRNRTFSLLDDIERLDEAAARIGDVSLIVIDPVTAFLGTGRIDSHNNTDIRSVMMDLQGLAERRHAAVLGVSHLSKGRQQQALMAVMGSLGWVAAARAAYGVFRDEDGDGSRRLMLPLKNNIGDDKSGFGFTIEPTEIEGGIATSRISWESAPVTQSADDIYAPDERTKSQVDEAVDFFRDALADGPRLVKEVKQEAKDADIAAATLRRARERLGIRASRERFDGDWTWALPDRDAPSCSRTPPSQHGQDGHDGQDGETDSVHVAHLEHVEQDGGSHPAHVAHDVHRESAGGDEHDGPQRAAPTRHLLERACEGLEIEPDELRAGLVDEDLEDLDLGEMDPDALRHWAEHLEGLR